MSMFNLIGGTPPSGGFYPYEMESSVLFDGSTTRMTRVNGTPTNEVVWTWNCWLKRSSLNNGTDHPIFSGGSNTSNYEVITFWNSTKDTLLYSTSGTGTSATSAVFRDVTSWYNLTVQRNGSTMLFYVNGQLVHTLTGLNASDSKINEAGMTFTIGGHIPSLSSVNFDGYMTDVYFADGTAYDADTFGEYINGVWVAKKSPAVTLGNNGFYLPMKGTTQSPKFSTTLYTGNATARSIKTLNSPDIVWIKNRSASQSHNIFDSVRGANNLLYPNLTNVEASTGIHLTAFNSDGFDVGTATSANGNNHNMVAWSWDLGNGSPVSNTDGTITSTVKANTDMGTSVVAYTGTSAVSESFGHGLNQAPELVITKALNSTDAWRVHGSVLGTHKFLSLSSTNAVATDSSNGGFPDNTDTLVNLGYESANGTNYVAYCFHSVSNYQDVGTYIGNSGTQTVTTGFRPRWVMVKGVSLATTNWVIFDTARLTDGEGIRLFANTTAAESYNANRYLTVSDTGFSVTGSDGAGSAGNRFNNNNQTYLYLAIADTRDASIAFDASGNGNNFTLNNIGEDSAGPDVPTNNWATFNPLDSYPSAHTFSEGNLRCKHNSGTWRTARADMRLTSGQWYWETVYTSVSGAGGFMYGIGNELLTNDANPNTNYSVNYNGISSGTIIQDGTTVNTGTSFTAGDVMGLALDIDAGTVKFYKNNTLVYTVSSITGSEFYPIVSASATGSTHSIFNFGQDSTFAGNKTAGGNADGNGIGDFFYAPPSGLALCSANLPDTLIGPNSSTQSDDYFSTVLYDGDGTTSKAITGVGFQPDFTWIKARNVGYRNTLQDSVRGAGKQLNSGFTDAEADAGTGVGTSWFQSFDSDGFTVGDPNSGTYSGNEGTNGVFNYVGWNWKAGGAAVTNTDGTLDCQVSANPDAGFSILSWNGNTTDNTIGHGLNSTPEFFITKDRDNSRNWECFHKDLAVGHVMYLNLTIAQNATGNTYFQGGYSAAGTNDTTIALSSYLNGAGTNMIGYAFHSVPGHQKVGSYIGNGSTDGTYVDVGFSPAFLLIGKTAVGGGWNWQLRDAARGQSNPDNNELRANSSAAESSSSAETIDFLSSGFKFRSANGATNQSSYTYIYLAIADIPAKYSLAR